MAADKTKFIFNPFSGNFDAVQNVADLVQGPASSTDLAIAIYDSTTGKLIKNSLAAVQSDGRITLGADGTSSLDAVSKQQLDAAIQGVDVKEGVVAASTINLVLSGTQTVDTIALIAGDRVLVKNQTSQTENGVYVVAAGAWSRATDADTAAELQGALVVVAQGSQANTGWYQITDTITLGVSNIVFNQFFGAGTYAADGNGIELTGSTFSLELDSTTLSKSATGLKVADLGITNAQIANAAAITLSKLAALTINRALVSDASGVISPATTTATEIGYVNGVTSSIQTQLNTKIGYTIVSVAVNTSAAAGTTYLVDSSGGARIITLPAPSANIYVVVKDIGNASTNSVTVNPNAAETIDGAASVIFTSDYEAATFVSNGTNWFRL